MASSGFRFRPPAVGEWILRTLSRDPEAGDFAGGTATTTIDTALAFMQKTVPEFLDMVADKKVLDFGCGFGLQAAALARASPSSTVVGLDLPRPKLVEKWSEYRLPNLRLTTTLPDDERFDVVYSCSSFEHFDEPAKILGIMRDRAEPGGKVVISFAEPWYSPRGSHMDGFTRLPWVNLMFSEATVMRVRSLYRDDGATRYEEVEGGLNRMTVKRFERLIRSSGLQVRRLDLHAVKGLPLVTRVPIARELLTAAASCVLEKRAES